MGSGGCDTGADVGQLFLFWPGEVKVEMATSTVVGLAKAQLALTCCFSGLCTQWRSWMSWSKARERCLPAGARGNAG